MIAHGEGTRRDKKGAAKWLRKAAEQGHPQAQGILGILHLMGDGVAENSPEGIRWLIEAANQDEAMAQYSLGLIYELGHGCDVNLTDAFKWYRRAAAHGYPGAGAKLIELCARNPTLEIRVSDLLDGRNLQPPLKTPSMTMQPLEKPYAIRLQFEAATVRTRDDLFVACSNQEERFAGFARLCRYRAAGKSPPWNYVDLPVTISDATLFTSKTDAAASSATPTFVFLSEEGDVLHLPIEGDMVTERIIGSGLWAGDSEGWGSMLRIVQIGTRLHACGHGGQVYRRLDSGTWEHIDIGLLNTKMDKDGLSLKAIAGVSESEIYVGGWRENVNDGVLFCWDGRRWTSVAEDIPAISDIHVQLPSGPAGVRVPCCMATISMVSRTF